MVSENFHDQTGTIKIKLYTPAGMFLSSPSPSLSPPSIFIISIGTSTLAVFEASISSNDIYIMV